MIVRVGIGVASRTSMSRGSRGGGGGEGGEGGERGEGGGGGGEGGGRQIDDSLSKSRGLAPGCAAILLITMFRPEERKVD